MLHHLLPAACFGPGIQWIVSRSQIGLENDVMASPFSVPLFIGHKKCYCAPPTYRTTLQMSMVVCMSHYRRRYYAMVDFIGSRNQRVWEASVTPLCGYVLRVATPRTKLHREGSGSPSIPKETASHAGKISTGGTRRASSRAPPACSRSRLLLWPKPLAPFGLPTKLLHSLGWKQNRPRQ